MNLPMNLRKYIAIFSTLLLLGVLGVSVPGTTALAAPTVNITSPIDDVYCTVGTNLHIRAYVSGNPTSVTAHYLHRQSYNNNADDSYSLGSLTRDGGTNYWELDYTVSGYSLFPRLSGYSPNLAVIDPRVQISATDGGGTGTDTVDVIFCCGDTSFYSDRDSTFFYANPYTNPFWGCYTGRPGDLSYPVPSGWTYNCMAFALGIEDSGWAWSWGGYVPTYAQVCSVLQAAPYNYTTCQQTAFSGAEVIYYAKGHFSKVWVWDIYGMPSQIRSKWGGAELISSLSGNPFTGVSYGSAVGYFDK